MNATLKVLIQKKYDHQKLKYPSLPDHAHVKPKYSDKTANGLTKCVLEWLHLSGHQAERISVQGRVIDGRKTVTNVLGFRKTIGSITRIKSSMQPGSADISATVYGRSVKIEIKIGRDQQSEAQMIYQRQVEAAGGTYLVAKTFQQFYDWYFAFRKEVLNE